jgi:inorganic pyrophosphatase
MSIINNLSPGDRTPDEINVIIEIPANSEPIKYEVDKDSGMMFVDRFMSTSMVYPCDYGYIPQTLSKDNDPVDVLVVCPFPLISGSVARCRPIGILSMEDEQGHDSKLLAVPIDQLTSLYSHVRKPDDLPAPLLNKIQHFFQHYKDLEPNKWVKIKGWEGSDEAKQEIIDSLKRYQQQR